MKFLGNHYSFVWMLLMGLIGLSQYAMDFYAAPNRLYREIQFAIFVLTCLTMFVIYYRRDEYFNGDLKNESYWRLFFLPYTGLALAICHVWLCLDIMSARDIA